MSRGSSVVMGAMVGAGGLLLLALPILRLLVLAAGLGMAALTALLLAEALYALARAVIPIRAQARIPAHDAEVPGIEVTVLALEAAAALGAVAILAMTSPLWKPALGIALPWWLFGLVAVRRAGLASLFALGSLRRPLASLVGLFDLIVMVPIVAIVGGSLEVVLAVSVTVTMIFVGLATMMAPLPPNEKTKAAAADPHDPWQLGTWLSTVSTAVMLPLVAIYAGTSAFVPFDAALLLTSILSLVFLSAALINPARTFGMRLLRGIALSAAGVAVLHTTGPWLFRVVFPDSFGDGSVIRILAWGTLAALPLALRTAGTKNPSQLRHAISGVVGVALAVGGALLYGLPGLVWMLALRQIVCAAITLTEHDPALHGH